MNNLVNHPSHYSKEGRKECIEEMRELFGVFITAIFCLTNAYKYIYRAGEKSGNSEQQDMAKAKWYYSYADRIIDPKWLRGSKLGKLYDYIRYIVEDWWVKHELGNKTSENVTLPLEEEYKDG